MLSVTWVVFEDYVYFQFEIRLDYVSNSLWWSKNAKFIYKYHAISWLDKDISQYHGFSSKFVIYVLLHIFDVYDNNRLKRKKNEIESSTHFNTRYQIYYFSKFILLIYFKLDLNFYQFPLSLHENGFMTLNTSFLFQYILGVNHV